MKILIDSDVLLDIAFAREPHFDLSKKAYAMLLNSNAQPFITPLILGNLIYLISKYRDKEVAKQFIKLVLKNAEVLESGKSVFLKAFEKNYRDLEDGIQIEAAKQAKIDLIITRNLRDYQNDQILVKTPEQYLASFA